LVSCCFVPQVLCSCLTIVAFQMSLNAKCSWTSQVLGLFRFCQASLKNDCQFLKISGYTLVLKEVRSRFLLVLSWRTPKTCSTELIKLDMKDKLQVLVDCLEVFLGTFEDLVKVPPPSDVIDDLLRTIFSLYPLTWGDMRVKNSHMSMFKVMRREAQEF
jgi:hypothetical protein